MNREINAIVKTVFDFIDQISENISDIRERQEKIKIVLLSMFGTIIGLCAYNNYMVSNASHEIHNLEETKPCVKPNGAKKQTKNDNTHKR